ncbi:protein translocase subunit SecF [bacterium]|nr:protein translocase subunit SecF [bacterium]
MKIFKTTPQYQILGKKKIAFILSGILMLASIVGLLTKGLTYGIDFKGGTQIQIKFNQEPELETIRELFQKEVDTAVNITTFGEKEENEVIITLSKEAIKGKTVELTELIDDILKKKFSEFDIRRIETVGAKVGDELKTNGIEAALFVLIGILIYVGFRFKMRYGVAAVVALFHDVLITMGFFVFLEKEFTLTILAAILTIIGYSLNDTIVVFDRVRENIARFPKRPMEEVINLSVNETLSRTILTALTTILVVFALYILGGEIIRDFSFAMLIGLVVGTYSSIFVASPVVILLEPSNLEKNQVYKKYNEIAEKLKQRFGKNKGKKAK